MRKRDVAARRPASAAPASSGAAVRPAPLVRRLQQRLGNHGTQALTARIAAEAGGPTVASSPSTTIQTSLAISQPGDRYEREADRIADIVMRMPAAPSEIPDISAASSARPPVRRACVVCKAVNEHGNASGSEPDANGAMSVQRMAVPGAALGVTPAVEANVRTLQGQGSPLPQATRQFFEPRFGADFSQVRVNTGGRADETARSLGAKAFTVGSSISFGAGQFAPTLPEGQRLLAHELTHVVQQDGAVRRSRAPARRKESEPDTADKGKASLAISKSTEGPRLQPSWYNVDIPFTDYQFDPSWSGVKTAAGVVKDAAREALEAIVNQITSVVDGARAWLNEKWAEIQSLANAAWDGAKLAFDNIIGLFKNPLGLLADAIMGLDADSLAKGWATFLAVVNSVANGFKAMAGNVLGTANRLWGFINRYATGVLDKVASLTSNFLFRKLPESVQKGLHAIVDVLKSLWKSIADGWTALTGKIKRWVDGAIDAIVGLVLKVAGFGINVVISGIAMFGQLVLFLKDLFSNPGKYVELLAERTVQAFGGVESKFAGVVGQYFGGAKTSTKAVAHVKGPAAASAVKRAPPPAVEKKGSASWSDIGSGVLEMMGEKWSAFKSNPMSVVMQLLKDLIFPMAGNIDDIIELFKSIWHIVTGPLSAGSLEELWTSLLQIMDIPILIFHTVVSILMRSLMVPLIVASFIPHPVVKGVAAAVGYALLGAFVQAELLNIGHKLVLLKTGATTGEQKKDAYNRIADSLIAFAMTAAIMLLMLVLHFLANVAKGIYNFIKGKVFGVEPLPVEGRGSGQGEAKAAEDTLLDAQSKKGVAAERTTADGHKIKIMEDGRIFICTTCEELRFKYRSEIAGDEQLRTKLGEAERIVDPEAKADRVSALQKELADARENKLAAEPPEVKGKLLAEMRATVRKIIGEIKEQLRQREVIDTLRENPEVKAEIDADVRQLDAEMSRVEKGAKGVEGDPALEDAAREEFDTVRAQGEAVKEKINREINPPEGATVPRPGLKYPKNMLPTGGEYPYVSPDPSGEVVQATGEKSGYLDKDGNVWQVDRTKARTQRFFEWDVQTKDGGHINVGSDGTITH